MIALCLEHHKEADIGVFTKDYLRKLKSTGNRNSIIAGQFHWSRETTMFVVGGMNVLGCSSILRVGRRRIIWFTKSPDGCDLLNFDLHAPSSRLVCSMRDNEWQVIPDIDDLEATCGRRSLSVRSTAHNVFLKLDYEVIQRSALSNYGIDSETAERIERALDLEPQKLTELLVCKVSGRNNWPVVCEWTDSKSSLYGATFKGGLAVASENVMRVGISPEEEEYLDLWEYTVRTLGLC